MLGYEAVRSYKPRLLGSIEEKDQVGDQVGFSQDHDAGHLVLRLSGSKQIQALLQCNHVEHNSISMLWAFHLKHDGTVEHVVAGPWTLHCAEHDCNHPYHRHLPPPHHQHYQHCHHLLPPHHQDHYDDDTYQSGN